MLTASHQHPQRHRKLKEKTPNHAIHMQLKELIFKKRIQVFFALMWMKHKHVRQSKVVKVVKVEGTKEEQYI